MKVLVQVALSEITSNGKDGTGLVETLGNWGLDVFLEPLQVIPPIRSSIAKLLMRPTIAEYDFTISCDGGSFIVTYKDKVDLIDIQAGYDSNRWKSKQRNWDKLNFAIVDSDYNELVIKAYSELRETNPEFKDTQLNIKTSSSTLPEGITIHSDPWSEKTFLDFYRNQHVLLALDSTRNVSTIEFASTGGVIIGINEGDNKAWMSSAYAYPIVNLSELQQAMLSVFNNRNEARRKGELAAEVMPQMFDWDKVLERLLLKVARVPEGRFIRERIIFERARTEAANNEQQSRE